jgi:hypothetical protein
MVTLVQIIEGKDETTYAIRIEIAAPKVPCRGTK